MKPCEVVKLLNLSFPCLIGLAVIIFNSSAWEPASTSSIFCLRALNLHLVLAAVLFTIVPQLPAAIDCYIKHLLTSAPQPQLLADWQWFIGVWKPVNLQPKSTNTSKQAAVHLLRLSVERFKSCSRVCSLQVQLLAIHWCSRGPNSATAATTIVAVIQWCLRACKSKY